ncbi:hypothetical protein BUZ85_17775, partial [Mammaliicoccus sciuri]
MKQLIAETEETLAPYFKYIEEVAYENQEKVLNAFHAVKATENDLQDTTGYGYDDLGRDHLEAIYAHAFKAEDAIVRPQIISGTHAITIALQSVLKYGDELLYITGNPYDTLLEVIGINGNGIESLREQGVSYDKVDLKESDIDIPAVFKQIKPQTKEIDIQRSKDYAQTPSITLAITEQTVQ